MNVFLLMGIAAALVLGQGLVFRHFGMRGIRYRRYFSAGAVYAGQTVEMIEEISNRKFLPVPWLRVEAHMSRYLVFGRQENLNIADDLYHRSLFALAPWRKITRTHHITCLRRGCYRIDSVALTCGDLLGLGQRSTVRENPMELIVYPQPMDFRTLDVPSRRWQGDVVVRRFIEPDPFLINGIRPWRNGDAFKDVHWGATARTGELQVKTRDYTASPRLLIVLNVQQTEDQWGDLNETQQNEMEAGVTLAATYAAWAQANGVETAFCCNGAYEAGDDRPVEVPLGAGPVHLDGTLETLARLRILRRRTFPTYLDEEVIARGVSGYDIVMLSWYWSQLLEERAGRLRRMGNSVTWINPTGGNGHA